MTPRRTRQPQTHAVRARRAFTLIELLIVIGIIAVLISMSLVVGSKVIEGGKGRATQNVIRVLDESRAAWTLNADVPLPKLVSVEYDTNRAPMRFLLIDGRSDTAGFETEAYPTIALYTGLVMQDASIRSVFEQLDSTFIRPDAVPGWKDKSGKWESWAIGAVEVRDAWGKPLRMVHPAFHGGHGEYWNPDLGNMESRDLLEDRLVPVGEGRSQLWDFSRSYRPFEDDDSQKGNWIGDADEGMCIGGTAYFYSAGADGDPGTRRNNIYSTVPRFPVETRDFK